MTKSTSRASTELPRILIVDDNPAIHQDFLKILVATDCLDALDSTESEFFGESSDKIQVPSYNIDSAFQGEEGYRLVQESMANQIPYRLAFVDMRMPPGWDGLETVKHLWSADPELQIVICTAHSDYTWQDMVEAFGHNDQLLILKKPFDNAEVSQLAAALTEKRRLLDESRKYTLAP